MPDTCYVLGDIPCPSCQEPLLEAVRCQWGVVPNHKHYRIGDAVRWMKDCDGSIIKPFTIREDENGRLAWNCGDPAYRAVVLLDIDLALRNTTVDCPRCGTRLAEVIAVVRDGIFQEVRALNETAADKLLGDSAGKLNIIIVREDGTYWPREDWWDIDLVYVDDNRVPAI